METNTLILSEIAQIILNKVQTTLKNSPTKISFISINGYTNKDNEVSNNLINIGISYNAAKQKDIEKLNNTDILKLENTVSDKPNLLIAKQELLNSLIKPDTNKSEAQKNAYTNICEGLKIHNETGILYIYGYRERKTIISKGIYKEVNSATKTIAKNELKNILNLRTNKFVQFSINNISNIKINDEILEF